MTVADLYYDPYDYAIDADPYPVWARLRDEAPLYFNERHGFYALSRYDDVLNGLLDHETFVSGHGIVLEAISDEPFSIPMMIMMDPPRHTRLRKLVSRAFTPRQISDLEPKVREICAAFLDPLVGGGEFDFVARFAGLLPPTVILALLGFPKGLAADFREVVDSAMHLEEGSSGHKLAMASAGRSHDIVTASSEFNSAVFDMLPELLEQRRTEPQDDLLSGLVHAEIDDEDGEHRQLTTEEIYAFVNLLSLAGSETVARLLAFAAVTLARFPDQRRLLADDPSLIPNAVEETLRYEAPSPIQARWVARDIELYGTVVKRGSKMALLNGSADRDERHFPRADVFDVRRDIDRHLAFGYGIHFCVGAAVARLEGRVGLSEVLKRFPTWDVDESRLGWVHTSTVRGYTCVPFIPG
jgi:cytochrome P450